MKKLSVCLIVKNEEAVLERCLKCVSQFADEIIVVDTGSTDSTINISKQYTDKIYYFEWNNNFADARNFAFKQATCEYLMWIDADDIVTDDNIEKILTLKKNLSAETYMAKYQIAFDQNGNVTFEYYRERIVKNTKNAKFYGFVHEVITPFGKIEYTDIAIQHQKSHKTSDRKRNLNLYRYHIRHGAKLSTRETFYYARELYYNCYYTSTINVLKKYLKMDNKFLPNIIDAYIILSDCNLYLNNVYDAKKFLFKSFHVCTPNPLICCKIGNLEIRNKNFESAIFWYKSALISEKNLTSGAFIENDYYDFVPYIQLSFCYYQIGNHKNFVKYHNLAKSIKPYDKSILNNQKYV